MGPTHRIESTEGRHLGDRLFNAAVWEPGDTIPLGEGREYVVVSVVPPTRDGELVTLVVREE